MIEYNPSSVRGFFSLHGSVAPRAMRWAIPCACLAYFYHWLYTSPFGELATPDDPALGSGETVAWTMSTSSLGFLLIFRTQIAYSRYWEGITLVERACAVWLNSCSNLVAFRNTAPGKKKAVAEFLHVLTRISSLLLAISMAELSDAEGGEFPHLSTSALEPEKLAWLQTANGKQKVVLQWIQKHIVEGSRGEIIDIAPPILSRCFQEFSNGIVHMTEARKLTAVPLPFEFAQMTWLMLVSFSLIGIPCALAVTLPASRAVAYTFLIVFSYWSIYLMAVEIEMPYGRDPNDLPLQKICAEFNMSLMSLLEPEAQDVPRLLWDVKVNSRWCSVLSHDDEPRLMRAGRSFGSEPFAEGLHNFLARPDDRAVVSFEADSVSLEDDPQPAGPIQPAPRSMAVRGLRPGLLRGGVCAEPRVDGDPGQEDIFESVGGGDVASPERDGGSSDSCGQICADPPSLMTSEAARRTKREVGRQDETREAAPDGIHATLEDEVRVV